MGILSWLAGNDEPELVPVEWGTDEAMDTVEQFNSENSSSVDYDSLTQAMGKLNQQGISFSYDEDESIAWHMADRSQNVDEDRPWWKLW